MLACSSSLTRVAELELWNRLIALSSSRLGMDLHRHRFEVLDLSHLKILVNPDALPTGGHTCGRCIFLRLVSELEPLVELLEVWSTLSHHLALLVIANRIVVVIDASR